MAFCLELSISSTISATGVERWASVLLGFNNLGFLSVCCASIDSFFNPSKSFFFWIVRCHVENLCSIIHLFSQGCSSLLERKRTLVTSGMTKLAGLRMGDQCKVLLAMVITSLPSLFQRALTAELWACGLAWDSIIVYQSFGVERPGRLKCSLFSNARAKSPQTFYRPKKTFYCVSINFLINVLPVGVRELGVFAHDWQLKYISMSRSSGRYCTVLPPPFCFFAFQTSHFFFWYSLSQMAPCNYATPVYYWLLHIR